MTSEHLELKNESNIVELMQQKFYKYQGTGNDFIMIDNRMQFFPKNNTRLIESLCDRKFGIGADGLILLEDDASSDFRMVYYNSDGRESTMCGNGGRCLVAFAAHLGLFNSEARFMAVDGLHFARLYSDGNVSLQMKDVSDIKIDKDYVFLDTGSPHHVEWVTDLDNLNVKEEGARIRYSSLYGVEGANVNFVMPAGQDIFRVRTYERGVEDETLSCGTGVTAVALAMYKTGRTRNHRLKIQVEGGELSVSFEEKNGIFTDVFLEGPARYVFEGMISLKL